MSQASNQITEYLSVGGLFNPEIMNQTQHEAVRDTLIKARDDIQQLERENAALRKALEFAVEAYKEDEWPDVVADNFYEVSCVARDALTRKEPQP